ncbi:ABC transporter permease [Pseudomonas sp. CAU 1711]|uniref:MlaE family ABC transporter permease n=1 Tax=Pseudomonas sp. CAU 1711 TaxID=3140356 RepID=UPI00326080A5
MAAAELRWQQDSQGRTHLCVSGHWTLAMRKPDLQTVLDACVDEAGELPVRVSVASWDSSLLALLRRLLRQAEERQLTLRWLELPTDVERLLQLGSAHPIQPDGRARPGGPLTRLGLLAMDACASLLNAATFLGDICLALWGLLRGQARMRAGDFWLALQQCGPGALPIVALIAILVGLILAFVGAAQLQVFGAQLYIANMVAIGMTREMGALMTAVIMAGRTGAAYAAELGSMQANEEIDALKTFGFPPLEFLVLPRLLALLLAMPLLCAFADALGILGGFIIGAGLFDISAAQYLNQSLAMLSLGDFLLGLFKSLVFAVLIGLIGCHYGLSSGRNAQAVGQATTRAVVSIIVALVIADALITLICTQLGI